MALMNYAPSVAEDGDTSPASLLRSRHIFLASPVIRGRWPRGPEGEGRNRDPSESDVGIGGISTVAFPLSPPAGAPPPITGEEFEMCPLRSSVAGEVSGSKAFGRFAAKMPMRTEGAWLIDFMRVSTPPSPKTATSPQRSGGGE